MRKINYESVKEKAIVEFLNRSGKFSPFPNDVQFLAMMVAAQSVPPVPVKQVADEIIDYGTKLIENWDIRRVTKLIELFPSCVPQYLRNKAPTLDYDEKGDWCLFYEFN